MLPKYKQNRNLCCKIIDLVSKFCLWHSPLVTSEIHCVVTRIYMNPCPMINIRQPQ